MAQQVIDIVIRAKNETAKALNEPIKGLDDLAAKAKALGPAMAAAGIAAAAGLAYMVKGSIDAADSLSKMSARTGASVEDLSTMQHALDLSGVSMQGFEKALQTANKTMLAAAQGQKGAQQTMETLGVAYQNADGTLRSTTEVMADVADKFATMQDGAAKNAMALDLFGKSGAELIPMLNGGSKAIREMQGEARALGLEISTGTAKASEAFNDNLSRLGSVGKGFANILAADLAPTLANASGWFADAAVKSDAWKFATDKLGDALRFVVRVVATLGAVAVQTFSTIGQGWGALMAAIVAAANGEFSQARNILLKSGDEVAKGWKDIGRIWSDDIPAAAAGGAKKVKVANLAAVDAFEKEAEKLRQQAEREEIKRREDSLAYLARLREEHAQATMEKIDLIAMERDAELAKIEAAALSEQEKADARLLAEETYQARKAELEAEAAERARAEQERQQAAYDAAVEKQIEAQNKLAEQAEEFDKKRRENLQEMIDYGGSFTAGLVAGMKTFTDSSIAGSKKMEVALKRVGDTFLDVMLDALIRAAAQALVAKATDFAATLLFAEATAAAWAPAATAATIATVGGAAAQAPVSIGASVAATQGILAVAHGGLDMVPREGTYFLQKGEAVVAPPQNQELKEFLAREKQGAGGKTVEAHLYVDGRELLKFIGDASADGRLAISSRSIKG